MPCPISSWLGKSEINMHVQSCSYSTVFYLHNERAIWYIGCWIQTTFRSTYYFYGSTYYLWSTDSAGKVPHRSLMRGAASDMAARASMPRWPFFFFFFFFSRIRVDSARFAPTRLLFSPTRPESSQIGSYWLATEMALNHARTAETGLWMRPKSVLPQFYSENLLLLLCLLPSSFFVLWIKA